MKLVSVPPMALWEVLISRVSLLRATLRAMRRLLGNLWLNPLLSLSRTPVTWFGILEKIKLVTVLPAWCSCRVNVRSSVLVILGCLAS